MARDHGLGAQAAALRNGADADTRREILALRNDPEISARMAGELARENADDAASAAWPRAERGRTLRGARDGPGRRAAFDRSGAAGRAERRGALPARSRRQSRPLLRQRPAAHRAGACSIACSSTPTPAWAPQRERRASWSMAATAKRCRRRLAQALFAFALLPLLAQQRRRRRAAQSAAKRSARTRATSGYLSRRAAGVHRVDLRVAE